MTERDLEAVRTRTLWGGAGFGSGGLLMLATATLPLAGLGSVLSPMAAVLVLVGAVVLVVLPPGDVTGSSRLGSAALIVFGASGLLIELFGQSALRLPPTWSVVLGMTLVWLTAVAAVLAALAVLRAGILRGFARWVLVLPAAAYLLMALMETVPLGVLTAALTAFDIGLSVPISLLATGIALVGFERWTLVGRRVRSLDEAWRASTSVGAPQHETSSSR